MKRRSTNIAREALADGLESVVGGAIIDSLLDSPSPRLPESDLWKLQEEASDPWQAVGEDFWFVLRGAHEEAPMRRRAHRPRKTSGR